MRPYSLDLRQRVAAAVDRHEGTWRGLATRFQVSLSFVARLVRHRRQTGTLTPKPHGGGRPPALRDADLERLGRLVQEQPDATLDELRQRLGVPCSRTALWRALRRLRLTRKKKTLRADERDTPRVQALRQVFGQKLAAVAAERLVFVDESGTTTALTRTHGRSPRGQRVYGTAPGGWKSLTLVSGMRLSGVVAPWTFAGATDGPAFATYVTEVLAPQLQPGDVVVWDNLRPHKQAAVVEAVTQAGATVEPAPPWSPDLLPIEKLWSKVKGALRSAAARTTATLIDAMGTALLKVYPEDIRGWFQSCGLCATHA
jgi:transposase